MNFVTRNILAFVLIFTICLGFGFWFEHDQVNKLNIENKRLSLQAQNQRTCKDSIKNLTLSPYCDAYVQDLFIKNQSLENQLKKIETDRVAAINRASVRNNNSTNRKINDAIALQKAVRDSNGNINCDTACLRQRFEN